MAQAFRATLASLQNVLTWTPYSSDRSSPISPQHVKLPDLLAALPDAARDFRVNALCKEISEASDEWASAVIGASALHFRKARPVEDPQSELSERRSTCAHVDEDREDGLLDLKTGLLASMCFPTADRVQLKLCADFLAWIELLEHLLASTNAASARVLIQENILLAENEPGCTEISDPGFTKGLQSILNRFERSPESTYVYDRFRSAIHSYLQLLSLQLSESSGSKVPQSPKAYLARQRDRGWHTPLFILIEYAHGLKLSSNKAKSAVRSTRDAAAEAIVYALDIYTCAGAISRTGSSLPSLHNSVTLLADGQSIDLPQAIERVDSLCADRLRTFSTLQASLLSKSSDSASPTDEDAEIALYCRGLGDCVRGVLQWAFESERYFGRDGAYVRMTLLVEAAGGESTMHDGIIDEGL